MKLVQYRQAGFSVFDIALVMLLSTFILGSLFSMHVMIDRSTAKKLAAEMRDVKDMLYTYRDRYKAIPGDDYRAAEHVPGALADLYDPAHGFGGDGLIRGLWAGNQMTWGDEAALFWNHVRLAGLAPGDPQDPDVRNAVDGRLGVTSDTRLPTKPARTQGLYFVCSSGITGNVARMVDLELDDGDATRGIVWAAAETAHLPIQVATAPTPYDDGSTFTVCMAF